MFDKLVDIAGELRDGLQERLRDGISQGVVQGAQLEVDRYWYLSALRENVRGRLGGINYFSNNHIEWVQRESAFSPLSLDWSYRPDDWDRHCTTLGYLNTEAQAVDPVLIRVLLRDPMPGDDFGLRTSDYRFEAKQLLHERKLDLPRMFQQHPIVYEVRPPALGTAVFDKLRKRFASLFNRSQLEVMSVGRANPNTFGTLGGALRDVSSGTDFVISCAHVLGPVGSSVLSPGPIDGRKGSMIGRVRFNAIPPIKSLGQTCNLHSDPFAGRLDLAVAELNSAIDRSGLQAPNRIRNIAQMHNFQPVSFTGAVSGAVSAQLNAVTIWQEILTPSSGDEAEGFRCFGDIFELAGLWGDQANIAVEGDSGAWIFDKVEGLISWNGMLIGTQGARAYGCFAEHVVNALTAPEFPNGLSLAS